MKIRSGANMNDHIMIGDVKVLIDTEDYERVNRYTWRIEKSTGNIRTSTMGLNTTMQKFILDIPADSDMTACHNNGDVHDKRKVNLFKCTKGHASVYGRRTKALHDLHVETCNDIIHNTYGEEFKGLGITLDLICEETGLSKQEIMPRILKNTLHHVWTLKHRGVGERNEPWDPVSFI